MLAALEADRLRVAELQTQILQLELSLSELRIQHLQAQERLDSYKYPILTLPNEIISEIFLHTLPSHPDFPPPTGLSSPTLLTQICRQWREIALATPELWSIISSLDEYDVEQEARMFRLWLKRSRYCPLHLRLGTDRAWVSDTVVEAAVAHRARWQYLTIGLDTEEGDFRLFDGPMPLLRHLELIVEPDEDSPGSIPFHEAPLLSTATLNEAAALRVRLPWVQLTSLTLLNVAPSECVPILVQTSNLLHCELYVCFDTSSDPEIRRDITLPRLQSLVLADPGERFVSDLLPRLIVPTLRSLRIPHYFLAPDPIDTVSAFLSKSGCTLGSLHVISAPSIPWMPYRQEFPSLWELSFTS